MANRYKVPQDVEADDKLLGPFSFRQFIYLMVAAVFCGLGWALWTILPPLVLIVAPFVVVLGALALPLRKDQPMEVYLGAVVSYHLKPKKRLWKAEGIDYHVEVIAPKIVEERLTKEYSWDEANRRLSYLADVVDTRGWAVRGVPGQEPSNSSMHNDYVLEAQSAPDILDSDNSVAHHFDEMISKADADRRQQLINQMKNPNQINQAPQPIQNPSVYSIPNQPLPPQNQYQSEDSKINFNPYPENIHQNIIQPLNNQNTLPYNQPQQPIQPQQNIQTTISNTPENTEQPPIISVKELYHIPDEPLQNPTQNIPLQQPIENSYIQTEIPNQEIIQEEEQLSPDIINLANQHDLSIETIQREANRIKQKEEKKKSQEHTKDEEVFISLR